MHTMSWLFFALAGMTIWSATAVADRYFLLNVRSPRFYVIVPCLLQLPLMLLVLSFFGLQQIDAFTLGVGVMSGVLEAAILYYLFVAISSEEVSRVFPLTGLGPMLTMLFAWLVWNDSPTHIQFFALILFMIGGIVLSFKRSGDRFKASRALMPIALGSLLTSAFMLSLSFSIANTDFWTGFFYSRIGFFLAGAVIAITWRSELSRQWQALSSGLRTGIITNQVVAFSGHIFYFFSLSLASPALVQATLSMQSGIIFMIALLVSFLNPGLLEESMERRDILQKIIGIIFAIAATYLLAIA